MKRSTTIWYAVCACTLLLGMCTAVYADTLQAKLLAVYTDKNAIIVNEIDNSGQPWMMIDVPPEAKISIRDRQASLDELMAGQNVTVIYDMRMGTPVASQVLVRDQ